MLIRKRSGFLVILFITVLPKFVKSQEIIGDTIFVSDKQSSKLYFPQTVTYCVFDSANSNVSFEKKIDKNSVAIKTTAEDAETTILEVKEGSREHMLILVYKKDMSPTDYVHDWDDMDKLNNYVAESFLRKGLKPDLPEPVVAVSSPKKKANRTNKKNGDFVYATYPMVKDIADSIQNKTPVKKQEPPLPKNIISREAIISLVNDTAREDELPTPYDSIISLAANSLTEPPYEKALDLYKQANVLMPEETYPLKIIKYVESLISDYQEKTNRQQYLARRAQIVYLISKANKALEEKKLDSAKAWLTEAIALQPTKTQGEYAEKKVEAIDIELQRIAAMPVKEEPKPAEPLTARQRRLKRQEDKRKAILLSNYKKDQPKE